MCVCVCLHYVVGTGSGNTADCFMNLCYTELRRRIRGGSDVTQSAPFIDCREKHAEDFFGEIFVLKFFSK